LSSSTPKDKARLRNEIGAHLEDFPHQLLALESAMARFGEDFELGVFKRAFEKKTGISAYNDVQAVERAFGRVQNYIAQLSLSGCRLAGLPLPKKHEGEYARAVEALREAGTIDAQLCRQLKRAQKARAAIEHDYVRLSAGRVHQAVGLVADAAPRFIGAYASWIKPHLQ